MKSKLFVAALASSTLLASTAFAFSFGDVVQGVAGAIAVDKAADAVTGGVTGSDENQAAQLAPADLSNAPPISNEPLAVDFSLTQGKTAIFGKRPKVAVVGYNVGAYQTAEISGVSDRGQGASVKMALTLHGVDTGMLQRIADAGHADLVSQLKSAGVDVVPADSVFASSVASSEIKHHNKPVEGEVMDGRAPKKLVMVGPSGVGAVTSQGMVSEGFAIVGNKTGQDLDAIVLYPNVAFDFAWTSGGGRSMFKKTASVEAGVRFSLDAISKAEAVYSKDGRFMDDWAVLSLADDVSVDDLFATMDKTTDTNNSGSVGFANALGLGMASRKSSGYQVVADPERYEALAMNAVKGFNRSLVEQIKSGAGS